MAPASYIRQISLASFVLTACGSSLGVGASPPTFTVSALSNIPGGTQSYVQAINNHGEAVGSVGGGTSACPSTCLATWSQNTPTVLSTLPGAVAYSINDQGQVTGSATIGGYAAAVVWTNRVPTALPLPGPQYTSSIAYSTNDIGQTVGLVFAGSGPGVPTLWTGTTASVLSPVPGFSQAQPSAINGAGQIVGSACCYRGQPEAVLWQGTSATVLPLLQPSSGSNNATSDGSALAINSAGVVVGKGSNVSMPRGGAAAWDNGAATSLGTLYTFGVSSAAAVNDLGVIVGTSETSSGIPHAVIWTAVGSPIQDLNSLISATAASELVLTRATGINNDCTIVADGYIKKSGGPAAFVLTVVGGHQCGAGL